MVTVTVTVTLAVTPNPNPNDNPYSDSNTNANPNSHLHRHLKPHLYTCWNMPRLMKMSAGSCKPNLRSSADDSRRSLIGT